jgi:hypothetical protein
MNALPYAIFRPRPVSSTEKVLQHVREFIHTLHKHFGQAAIVGGAAVNLYLNKLEDIRDIDIKVCLGDMNNHDKALKYIINYMNWFASYHSKIINNGNEYVFERNRVILDPVIEWGGPGVKHTPISLDQNVQFNILVLPHDVRDTQTRVVLRGCFPIDILPNGYYKYEEFIDVIIPHSPCHLHVAQAMDMPVLAIHDLVREQIALLESFEFKEGGRRFEERASKKKRIRALIPLLTEDLNSNNARRLSNELRGTNV